MCEEEGGGGVGCGIARTKCSGETGAEAERPTECTVSRTLEIEFRRKAGEGEGTWAREGRPCTPN